MTKNPFLNAFAALLYITIVACVMYYGPQESGPVRSVIAPIAIVSLFTLSAAVMGYIFMYQPLQLFLDGKKKEAVNLFLKTTGVFALITAAALTSIFSGLVK